MSLEGFVKRTTRQDFPHASCVWSQQFHGARRQEKQALFGLRWSKDDKQVEITYDNWHGNDWEVMVVRTDFAQVVPMKDSPLLGQDSFAAVAGAGVHDLIIEDATEAHEPLGVMGAKRTQLVLMAMLYRLTGVLKGFPALDESRVGSKPLVQEPAVRHVAFFHNHRREAGGSQEHPHSQCIAIPIIPTDVAAELEYARKRLEQPPRQCVYCEVVEAELALWERESENSRVLFVTEHFLAVVPFAPEHPFEVWIIPRQHHSCFSRLQTDPADARGKPTQLEDLSALVTEVVSRLYVVVDDPGYNLVVHTQPVAPSDAPNKWAFYHWHLRILPRALVTRAGFERSTGTSKLPSTPEEMAELLRGWGNLHASQEMTGSLAWHIKQARAESDGDTNKIGAVRRLKNITKILEPAAGQLVAFVQARALLNQIAEQQPSLLLSPRQQELPNQRLQAKQPEEHAGGEDGPHFRCCPATGRWVLFTTRSRRRTVGALLKKRTLPQPLPDCPFCNSSDRERNTFVQGYEDGKATYVIKNISPLFTDHAAVRTAWPRIGGIGPFRYIDGFGACEIVVTKAGHTDPGLPPAGSVLAELLSVVADRVAKMPVLGTSASGATSTSKCIRHITVFSNHGRDAGASTDHLIWQVVGSPMVPTVVERELEHHRGYSQTYSGRCCSCDMLDAEICQDWEAKQPPKDDGATGKKAPVRRSRIVAWSDDGNGGNELKDALFVALCPYASRSPLEIWIVPREHAATFGTSSSDTAADPRKHFPSLGALLHRVLHSLAAVAHNPGYTLVIQQAPVSATSRAGEDASYHWRIVIEPQKLNIPAGFESLTGIWSNIVLPEDAAESLREKVGDVPSNPSVGEGHAKPKPGRRRPGRSHRRRPK